MHLHKYDLQSTFIYIILEGPHLYLSEGDTSLILYIRLLVGNLSFSTGSDGQNL